MPSGVPAEGVPWSLRSLLGQCVDYRPAKRPAASLCLLALAEYLPATGGVHSAVLDGSSPVYRHVSPERPLDDTRPLPTPCPRPSTGKSDALARTRQREPKPIALAAC